ncbi:MAG: toxin-antitoxin system TumE family protein [Steroidobacteraceae bacterium]
MTRGKRGSDDEINPARSTRDEFYPKGRKGGVTVRIQTDYSRGGRLLRYSLALIDTHRTSVDDGRIIGYDNAHGYHHRHCFGKAESIEFESYESIERRFEAEVRRYLETGEV